jgi:hypothetical protein
MRFVRCAATAPPLTRVAALAAFTVLATTVLATTVLATTEPAFAAPASTGGPVIEVTPSVAIPGISVTFAVTCEPSATSATLLGGTLGLPDRIPMTESTQPGEFVTTVELPASLNAGLYAPSIDCSNGLSGTASLKVNPAPSGPTPSGAPLTGDGTTSSATGGPLTAAGLWLLAAGGLGVGVAGLLIRVRKWRAGARS